MAPNASAEVRSEFVEVDELRIHYLTAGEGEPVVLLHGFPTSSHLWRNIIPHIAANRRVLAPDLPGFGQSAKPLDASYSFRFYDKVLDGFLDAVGAETTGIAVHDLGGPIGVYWALEHPERVRELALLNTLVYPEMSWAVKAFIIATYLPGVRGLLASPRGIAMAMRFGMEHKDRMTPEVLEPYQAPFRDADARRGMLKAGHGLHPRGFVDIAKKLPGFTGPVRIIYGERDRILPDVAQTMARVKRDLPQAELTSLPRAGHFCQEDEPDEIGRLLADFFC